VLHKSRGQKYLPLVPLLDQTTLLGAFVTIASTIFVAELTDKDALLLLALSTKIKARTAFAAGSTAFGISTAIIVSIGYVLTSLFPVFWIKLVGGAVMIGYAAYEYFKGTREEIEEDERKIERTSKNKAWLKFFFGIVLMLIVLDLAGDATEVLTIVFVARFQDVFLVFFSAWIALIAASAVETALGNRLGKLFSFEKIRIFSLLVFVVIGSIVIITTVFFP
jgi:putative Ca2+/H+ antiporter (TMEM165/GDT1 family)